MHRTRNGPERLYVRSPVLVVSFLRPAVARSPGRTDQRAAPRGRADGERGGRRPLYLQDVPDKDHGSAEKENNLVYYAANESFLTQDDCPSGRKEPAGGICEKSSVDLPEGAEL